MLQVSSLTFNLGQMRILNGVDFSLRAGETFRIIGPNGSGKTTLFNCLSGFNTPSSGTITLNGENITHSPAFHRARLGIGRTFQNFGVFREMTVMENMLTALESKQSTVFFPWSKQHRENQTQALAKLDLVNLADKAKQKAGSLSGGQMRLLEIARSLAFGAEIFLLDEPTAGVSPKMKGEIEAALQNLQNLGKTILIIEHDINFIQKLSQRVIVLDTGRVLLDDTPETIRQDPRLQEIYFGNSPQPLPINEEPTINRHSVNH